MLNLHILVGNLQDDAKIKALDSGATLFMFIIVTETFLGEGKNGTEYHSVKYFCHHETYALHLKKALKKGNTIFARGDTRTDTWIDATGTEQRTKRLYADEVKIISINPPAIKTHPVERVKTPDPVKSVPAQRAATIRQSAPPPAAASSCLTIGDEAPPRQRPVVQSRQSSSPPAPSPVQRPDANFTGLDSW